MVAWLQLGLEEPVDFEEVLQLMQRCWVVIGGDAAAAAAAATAGGTLVAG